MQVLERNRQATIAIGKFYETATMYVDLLSAQRVGYAAEVRRNAPAAPVARIQK